MTPALTPWLLIQIFVLSNKCLTWVKDTFPSIGGLPLGGSASQQCHVLLYGAVLLAATLEMYRCLGGPPEQ